MSRSLTVAQYQELNNLDSTNAYIWLLYVEFDNSKIYLNSGNATITYDSNDYLPFPFAVDEHEESSSGDINAFSLSVPIVNDDFSAWIRSQRGFYGQTVNLSKHVNSTLLFTIAAKVNEVSTSAKTATFSLGFENLLKVRFPARRIVREGCQHEYGDRNNSLCGFPLDESWSPASCDKSFFGANGCIAHGETASTNGHGTPEKWPGNYGAFPGIPRQTV